jgi:hypothetical protein
MAETEIPEDVRQAAIAALDAYMNATGAGLLVAFEDQVGAVVTGILAERERAAKAAEAHADGNTTLDGNTAIRLTAQSIALNIRRPA